MNDYETRDAMARITKLIEARAATLYRVSVTLAGCTSAKRWVKDYKTLGAAKRRANALTGFGHVATVEHGGEVIYRGR